LYDYRKHAELEATLPVDERDLIHRMRLFERLHTPEEHKQFIADIIKAKRLRKEIAKLQMYRRIGIRSLAEAEKYELDKNRRQFHKVAQFQKEAEAKAEAKSSGSTINNSSSNSKPTTVVPPTTPEAAVAATATTAPTPPAGGESARDSLWKQYRTSDRKVRRSLNRSGSSSGVTEEKMADVKATTDSKESTDKNNEGDDKQEGNDRKDDDDKKEEKSPDEKKESAEDKGGRPATEIDAQPSTTDKTDDTEMTDAVDSAEKSEPDPNSETAGTTEITDAKGDDGKMDVDVEEAFDISNRKGFDLLSRKEAALCERLRLYPAQYLEIKKALIHESFTNGLLDKEGGRRMVVKIDVERRGDIVDFMLRAGWISKKLAKAARTIGPVSAAE
jgi:hypothetical protein